MIITRTPTRISLIGGSTDLPFWLNKGNPGLVIGGAISHYSHFLVRKLPPYHDFKTRVCYSSLESVKSNLDIQHKAVKATIEYSDLIEESLEIFHSSDIPSRSGVGSSSTFVVGLLKSLAALQGKLILPYDLANAAIEIEQRKLGESVGRQDQCFASFGGLRIIKFRKDDFTVLPLELNCEQIHELEQHLMLFFTGISRTSSEISSTYSPKDRDMWTLLRLTEKGIDALYRSDYQELGELIDASWRIKSGLSPLVSNERISRIYANARIAGAWGGKLNGAGGGGMMTLLGPQEKRQEIIAAMEAEGCLYIPFKFEHDGSVIIFSDR